MAAKRVTIYCVEIEDEPGSLQGLLAQAASANVDLLCFAAFSAGEGKGRVYLSAKDPDALKGCAQEAGIDATTMAGFIVTDQNKVGAAADDLKKLAAVGINGVAGAAMVCEGQYQMLVVVSAADGDVAERAFVSA